MCIHVVLVMMRYVLFSFRVRIIVLPCMNTGDDVYHGQELWRIMISTEHRTDLY